MTHLLDDELLRWLNRPSDQDRPRIVSHLSGCNACAARYAAVVRAAGITPAHRRLDPAEFVPLGLAARGGEGRPQALEPRTRARGWYFAGLAAAAVVFLTLLVGRPPAPAVDSVVRGGAALELQYPLGEVQDATQFVWASPAPTSWFRLEIVDASGHLVHEARLRGTRASLPDDVSARLVAGEPYQWTVSRLDERGETVETTAPATFTIQR